MSHERARRWVLMMATLVVLISPATPLGKCQAQKCNPMRGQHCSTR